MLRPRLMPVRAVLALALAAVATAAAAAEEVQWRTDFAAARKEAQQKQRPLLLDFGTDTCFWCKKLDTITFRDPAIIKVLNEQFIPVKIDGDRDTKLTEALHIQSYPTLVFASPEGRTLGSQEGFVDAEKLAPQLKRVLADAPPPVARDTPPKASPEAVAAPATPTTEERTRIARELLMLAEGDLHARRYLGCLELCAALVAMHPDLPEAAEARKMTERIMSDAAVGRFLCQQLSERLGQLYLAQAEAARKSGDDRRAETCLERVVQAAPGTLTARAAKELLTHLRATVEQPRPPSATARGQAP